MTKVLIADDEANLRKVLVTLLEQDGYATEAVGDGAAALAAIEAGGIDILITDLKMPSMSGLEVLAELKTRNLALPVIVITAHGTVDTAVSALKSGAVDYITKPFDKSELKNAVRKAASAANVTTAPSETTVGTGRYRMIGQSEPMQQVFGIIDKVADTPSTVLVTGESGTGKELVAAALHENSNRKQEPFIKVNCAAIPKDLIESEFFGYERGAFTGAVSSKPGRFELADGGTLFLDEIGEVPTSVQVKLLRALQESEFERVGGVRTMRVDVRVITATNRDLLEEIECGTFREDLFYRLNVVPIHLPALRERPSDIPLLVTAFLDKYNKRLDKNIQGISPEALATLKAHPWPGNIRELENVMERAVLFTEDDRINVMDLPDNIRGTPAQPETGSGPNPREAAISNIDTGAASMKAIVRQATVEIERDLIVRALDETRGNVTRAASLLQISRKSLQNKMKEFGLREPEPKS